MCGPKAVKSSSVAMHVAVIQALGLGHSSTKQVLPGNLAISGKESQKMHV